MASNIEFIPIISKLRHTELNCICIDFILTRSIFSLCSVYHFLDSTNFDLPNFGLLYFSLFLQRQISNTFDEDMGNTVGIYVVKQYASFDEAEDIGIILEGIRVVKDNVALAVAMLFGLYVQNLSYPPDLRYTFEVIQKIWIELDGGKLSNKVLALKKKRISQ